MLDPLTALSLAGTICQFVDFGCKLVSQAQEIYHSPNGSTREYVSVEAVAGDIQSLNRDIINKKKAIRVPSKGDLALLELATKCQTEANELMIILNNLRLPEDAARWESFRKALQAMRKKGRIAELETRLGKLRKQVDRRILYMMSDQQSAVFAWFHSVCTEHTRIQLESSNRVEQLQSHIQSIIQQQTKDSNRVEDLVEKLGRLSQEGDRLATEQGILKSLMFDEWKRRFNQTSKSHTRTFTWIFRRTVDYPAGLDSPRFRDWLENGNGIYWIAGKAGAGKSTLMKFLTEHPKVIDCLKVWAGNSQPIIIPWFFWSAGSPLQRSQQGLLQSILFQILRRCPWLIPTICAARVSMYRNQQDHLSMDPWSLEELSEVFDLLAREKLPKIRFCLFIDGLDEYEGRPNELIQTLRRLDKSPHIKLCVASRPWNEFLVAFDTERSDGSLLLERHTRSDIELYVRDILGKDESFTAAERRDKRYRDFIIAVIDRARGVFLWVQLVVTRLLKGLGELNRLDDLKKKLDSVPPTLEKYFQQIFDRIDKTDWVESAKVFLATAHAVQPLSVVAYHFLEKQERGPSFALDAPIRPIHGPELRHIYNEIHTRLNFLCKDLIEVNEVTLDGSYTDYQVDFLHRTVKDFLMTKELREQLMKRATQDGSVSWDPHQALCNISLARAKSLTLQDGIQFGLNTLFRLVDELMFYAYEVEIASKTANVSVLDELDRVVSHYAEADMSYHWTNARDAPADSYFDEGNENCFLALAIQARLCLYVATKLDKKPSLIQSKQGRPLLDYALRPILVTPAETPNFVSYLEFGMVRVLLDRSADPNQKISLYGNITVWALFLLTCFFGARDQTANEHLRNTWFQAADMMIRKGADRKLKLETGRVEQIRSAGNLSSDGVAVKTAKYRTAMSDVHQSTLKIPQGITAQEIMIETFGEERARELNAIVAETRSWSVWSLVGWK